MYIRKASLNESTRSACKSNLIKTNAWKIRDRVEQFSLSNRFECPGFYSLIVEKSVIFERDNLNYNLSIRIGL